MQAAQNQSETAMSTSRFEKKTSVILVIHETHRNACPAHTSRANVQQNKRRQDKRSRFLRRKFSGDTGCELRRSGGRQKAVLLKQARLRLQPQHERSRPKPGVVLGSPPRNRKPRAEAILCARSDAAVALAHHGQILNGLTLSGPVFSGIPELRRHRCQAAESPAIQHVHARRWR